MTPHMPRPRPIPGTRRQAGASLIDILVGMVIGLIGMIVVFQSFEAFEARKRTTTTTTDAQESGLMALTTIERELRLAGYGMYYANQNMCRGLREWSNSAVTQSMNFLPAVITEGASNASDTIELTYSVSTYGATPSQIQATFNGAVAEIVVDNALSNRVFKIGDYVLVGNPTGALPCTRLQVSGVREDPYNPRNIAVKVEEGSSTPANPPFASLKSLLPTQGYTSDPSNPSVVSNMGTMRRVSYSVTLDSSHNGRFESRDLTSGAPAVPLADGIVNLQAQYGVSTAASVQGVSSWVNATGTWADANALATDQGRIKALRIAVVARSQLREKDVVQGVDMSCVNASGNNSTGPCAWKDTTDSPAPTIDLSVDPDWQHYRYRVYETIVPLRNVMWQSF